MKVEDKFNELDKRFYTKRNETFTKIMNWLDKPDYRDRLFNFMFKEVFNANLFVFGCSYCNDYDSINKFGKR